MWQELAVAGYVDSDIRAHHTTERLWLMRNGDDALGRVLWRQPMAAMMHNWGLVWRSLRARVPAGVYQESTTVTGIEPRATGTTVATDDGHRFESDLVVGADGYRSITRQLVAPEFVPNYAGYALWRGTYPEDRLPGLVPMGIDLTRSMATVCFPGGHAIFYLIPDFVVGRRLVNWGIYQQIRNLPLRQDPTSLPPGSASADLVENLEDLLAVHFPPYWAAVVRASGEANVALQPIYDVAVTSYARYPVVLIGDAGSLARPHTGQGTAKALRDALALERACTGWPRWRQALRDYDQQRRGAANQLVELGRRLGRDQVLHTPLWETMSPAQFLQWAQVTLAGGDSYLYES
jgi:2-polyprenyl-6-methoxyphenol hydroxylase-like FAD-dependent oxidoreductase